MIRQARSADLDTALALWQALHAEHESLDPRYRLADDAAARWRTSLRDWVRSDASRVLFAQETAASDPVGLITAHLYEPAPTYRPHLLVHVDDLYVRPEARGHGHARALVEAAADWGRAEGATQLRAGVLATNAAGLAFWASVGGADFSVTVAAEL
ncbi:N-acetyltransferase family protein [Rubrivirga sp. IMCC43871]|uniref:GNAT family N-acetyltransferase n=1 Tax=Rubrivirga sp. IMCC43871 TaxID=3391575 RepID=UPI00398FF0DB